MIAEFVITFRETLEAAIIIGIVLAYLSQLGRKDQYRTVAYGTIAAILASVATAIIFTSVIGGFEGRAEEIFEGIVMLIAAGVITYVVTWMFRQQQQTKQLHSRIEKSLERRQRTGIFLIIFLSVFREGVETALFLSAASVNSQRGTLGAVAGIVIALILGYAIYAGGKKLGLKHFFTATSFLFILFAAGLVAHGIHELQEAHVVLIIEEHIWDVNPPINADESYPALHEKGSVGSLGKQLFGYNGDPSFLEALAYGLYLAIIGGVFLLLERRRA